MGQEGRSNPEGNPNSLSVLVHKDAGKICTDSGWSVQPQGPTTDTELPYSRFQVSQGKGS
jgi:hypothetical protein